MFRRIAALATPLVLAAITASPVFAGPPWLSIELPANPLNSTTRGMYLLVRTYHHGTVTQFPVRGTATGMMDGQRRTLTLEFEKTNMPGVIALRKTWPSEGAWVLAITMTGEDGPTALVGVSDNGKVRSVDVPTQTRDGHTWGRPVTQQDIDNTLRAVAAADSRGTNLGLAGAMLLVPAALLVGRRRS
jgi:hypothetical protein